MFQPRSIQSSLSLREKLFSIDYVLVVSILILGIVSMFVRDSQQLHHDYDPIPFACPRAALLFTTLFDSQPARCDDVRRRSPRGGTPPDSARRSISSGSSVGRSMSGYHSRRKAVRSASDISPTTLSSISCRRCRSNAAATDRFRESAKPCSGM